MIHEVTCQNAGAVIAVVSPGGGKLVHYLPDGGSIFAAPGSSIDAYAITGDAPPGFVVTMQKRLDTARHEQALHSAIDSLVKVLASGRCSAGESIDLSGILAVSPVDQEGASDGAVEAAPVGGAPGEAAEVSEEPSDPVAMPVTMVADGSEEGQTGDLLFADEHEEEGEPRPGARKRRKKSS